MSLSSKQVTTGAAQFAQATPLPTAGPARLPGSPRVGDVRPASEDPTPAREARGPWLPCRATVPAAHALAWAVRPQSRPQGKGTTCETRREQSEDPRNPDADAASNRLVGGSRPTQAPPPAGAPPPPAVPRPRQDLGSHPAPRATSPSRTWGLPLAVSRPCPRWGEPCSRDRHAGRVAGSSAASDTVARCATDNINA